jgi:ubiquinone/menaquinone biosynthesis methyltransferase
VSAPVADLGARGLVADEHGGAVREMFGRIAPTYDVLNRVLSGGIDAAWRKRAIAMLEGAPSGPSLDLCAGTLDLTLLLDAARPHDRLIASDFSEPMLDFGRSKVPRAEVVVADAQALPFADASIAAVVCGFGIRNVGDPKKALAEVRRVLMPSGVFVTLEFFRPARLVTRVFHRAYATALLPAVGGLLSGHRDAYAYLARSMNGFLSRKDYEMALTDIGFLDVRGEDLTLGVASVVRAEVPNTLTRHWGEST